MQFVCDPTSHTITQVTRLLTKTTTNRQFKKQLLDQHKNYKVSNIFRVYVTSNNCLLSITTIQVMQSRVSRAQQHIPKSSICQFGEPNWFCWAGLAENSAKSKHWSTKDFFKNNWWYPCSTDLHSPIKKAFVTTYSNNFVAVLVRQFSCFDASMKTVIGRPQRVCLHQNQVLEGILFKKFLNISVRRYSFHFGNFELFTVRHFVASYAVKL